MVTPQGVVSRMSRTSLRRALGLVAICSLGIVAPAAAQTNGPSMPSPFNIAPASRPERPYRGLFGSGMGNTEQHLTMEASVGGGASDNPMAEQGAAGQIAQGGDSSATGQGSVKLLYSLSRTRFGINASNLALVDFYPGAQNYKTLPRDIATFGLNFLATKSTNLTFTQGFKNLPEFSYSELFGGDEGTLVPPTQDFAPAHLVRYKRYGTNVDLSHRLTARTRATFNFGYGHGILPDRDWITLLWGVNVSHTIVRGVAAYAGYQFGEQRDDAGTDRHPTVNFGVDFSRALSLTRKMSFSVGTGVAQIEDKSLHTKQYHLTGAAQVKREFGRSWEAGFGFGRNVRYVETLGAPLFTDSLSAMVQGAFSRRLQVRAGFGKSHGHVGRGIEVEQPSAFDTLFGSVSTSTAITRELAFGVDYAFYQNAAPSGAILAGQNNHHTIRASLQFWLPLMQRTKRPGA